MNIDDKTIDAIDILAELEEQIQASLREKFDKPDWIYRDAPWMPKEFFDLLLETIGEENYVSIAVTSKPLGDVVYYRGQFLIAPYGMQNIKDFLNVKEEEENAQTPQS